MTALPWNASFDFTAIPCPLTKFEGSENLSLTNAPRVNRPVALKNISGDSPNVVCLPSAGVGSVQRALSMLRQYRSLGPKWDGSKAEAANRRSFELAEQFLGILSCMPQPFRYDVQIFSSGTAVINVVAHQVQGQFEFLPDGTVSTILDSQGQEWDKDVEGFDGRHLPDEIARRLAVG